MIYHKLIRLAIALQKRSLFRLSKIVINLAGVNR